MLCDQILLTYIYFAVKEVQRRTLVNFVTVKNLIPKRHTSGENE